MNGIDDNKVRHLCRRFDPHGKGRVSYHEFVKYIIAAGEGRAYNLIAPEPKLNALKGKTQPSPSPSKLPNNRGTTTNNNYASFNRPTRNLSSRPPIEDFRSK